MNEIESRGRAGTLDEPSHTRADRARLSHDGPREFGDGVALDASVKRSDQLVVESCDELSAIGLHAASARSERHGVEEDVRSIDVRTPKSVQ